MTRAGQIELIHLEPTPAVVLGRTFRAAELVPSIEHGVGRVRAAVTAAQVPTAGAPFVRFVDLGDPLQVDIGIPLSGPHSVPTLRATVLPGGDAASMWHEGGLDRLLEGVERLLENVDRTPAGSPWASIWPDTDAGKPGIQLLCPLEPNDH
jgi:hypothetical protein